MSGANGTRGTGELGFLEIATAFRCSVRNALSDAANRSDGAQRAGCSTRDGVKIGRAPLRKGALEPANSQG